MRSFANFFDPSMIFGIRARQIKFESGNVGIKCYIPILQWRKYEHYWKGILKTPISTSKLSDSDERFMNY